MGVTYRKELTGTQNFSVVRYDASAGTYSSNLASTLTFDLFDNNATVGDILYIGIIVSQYRRAGKITFNIDTPIAGTGIVIEKEYWNGLAWTPIVDYMDETQDFTQTGTLSFYFDESKQSGWIINAVTGIITSNRLYFRFRISALTTITEGGRNYNYYPRITADRIICEDYGVSTAADFDDFYDADKAGIFDLMIRAGLTGTDAGAVNNTYLLRPAMEKTLGGTNNDLYLTVANYSGFTDATVHLVGTDRSGNAISEDIVVTADGTYYTVKEYATLDSTQITAVTGTGSLDYTVTQGQWGVFDKDRYVYKTYRGISWINCYFQENTRAKVLVISAKDFQHGAGTNLLCGQTNSFIDLGKLSTVATKATRYGLAVYVDNIATPSQYYQFWDQDSTSYIRLYGSYFTHAEITDGTMSMRAPDANNQGHVYNCFFTGGGIQCGLSGINGYIDIFNVIAVFNTCAVRRPTLDTTVERLTYVSDTGGGQVVWLQTFPGAVSGIFARGATDLVRMENIPADTDSYVDDCDTDTYHVEFPTTTNDTALLHRSVFVNARISDKDDNPLPNRTFIITTKTKNGTQVASVQTDANGEIAKQTISIGYCNRNNTNLDTDLTVDNRPFYIIVLGGGGFIEHWQKIDLDELTTKYWNIKLNKVLVNNLSKRVKVAVQ